MLKGEARTIAYSEAQDGEGERVEIRVPASAEARSPLFPNAGKPSLPALSEQSVQCTLSREAKPVWGSVTG